MSFGQGIKIWNVYFRHNLAQTTYFYNDEVRLSIAEVVM